MSLGTRASVGELEMDASSLLSTASADGEDNSQKLFLEETVER